MLLTMGRKSDYDSNVSGEWASDTPTINKERERIIMGRYYEGDIEGKFWFAVQESNDADFFGVTGEQPNYLTYFYST